MNTRLQNLRNQFQDLGIDAFLITKEVNIRYLTGFRASESWMLVTPSECVYITDFRYLLEAQKGLKGIASIECYQKTIYEGVYGLLEKHNVRRLGFDEQHLTVAQFKTLGLGLPKGVEVVAANSSVERLREIKDASEIAQTVAALKVHKAALKLVKRWIRPGVTERDVFLKLEQFVKSQKCGFSFPPIIASGANSCFPHASVTDRKLRRDEIVLVDTGIDKNGYKSDLTRMFYLGRIPKLIKDAHDHVAGAQQVAIAWIQDGMPVAEVDKQARNYLKRHNLDQYFGHALGHGVGLEIHENPRLSQKSEAILKEGMIVTVEPAVYIPNKFGIRIEDMALVTKKGCKVISGDID